MNLELELISIFESKEYCNRFSEYVKKSQVQKYTWNILESIKEFHSLNLEYANFWSAFSQWFVLSKLGNVREEDIEIYKTILDRVLEVSSSTLKDELVNRLVEREYSNRIAKLALQGAEGHFGSLKEINDLVEEYKNTVANHDETYSEYTGDIEDLKNYIDADGFSWRLPCLNSMFGKLKLGDFICIGSRPDSGKTTMLASEATYIAPQLPKDKYVVWLNNEEAEPKVKFRIIQSALGWTKEQVLQNTHLTKDRFCHVVGSWDKIRLFKDVDHIKKAEYIFNSVDVGLIIVDQLWNMSGFEDKSSNETDRQDKLFERARKWAKTIAPVINVHQLGGAAEGQLFPNMSQFYMSQTAIQGHVDAILMIGATHEPGRELDRGLWTPKNKLGSKAKYEVVIQPLIGRFRQ